MTQIDFIIKIVCSVYTYLSSLHIKIITDIKLHVQIWKLILCIRNIYTSDAKNLNKKCVHSIYLLYIIFYKVKPMRHLEVLLFNRILVLDNLPWFSGTLIMLLLHHTYKWATSWDITKRPYNSHQSCPQCKHMALLIIMEMS